MIGKTLAQYEILAKIGAGGMGEVYRAHDTTLQRDVAIKVLPEEFTANAERVARFQREARNLASLQHPKIASIYGFDEIEGIRFLAMELVEGEDLAQRLKRGPLPQDEALDLARQMTEGLEAAHEKGIVHRDLKPANIKVTPEGMVKILDFGLARAYQDDIEESDSLDEYSPTITAGLTNGLTILGTAGYMSPEQARGKPVDKRADVWAFGCVLFEMLTGHRCFNGRDFTEVIASIVKEEPDWSRLPKALPWRIRELLQQTLEKNPRQRLRDMGDIGLIIEKAQADVEAPPAVPSTGKGKSRPFLWGALLVILAAMVVGVITKPWASRSEPENLLTGATFTRLTDFAGSESCAAISRDGKTIAYLSDRGGQFNIWAIPVGTGQPYNVTEGLEGGVVSLLHSVGFSPDGSEIWLPGTLYGRLRRMPLQGGIPRNWLAPHSTNVCWSPDGSRVVYTTWDPGDPLIVADGDGSDRREILNSGEGYHQHFPAWSPDGWIYMVRGEENTREMDLWRVRPDGTESEPLVTGTRGPAFPTPIDEKTVLFIAQEQDGAGPWLWSFDLESRSARRLSLGLEQYTSVAASADGRRLAATVGTPRVGLWQVPISDDLATESDASPFELPTLRALAPRFGPVDLFYLSSRGTSDGLWRYRDGKSSEIWKGTKGPLLEPVAVSVDGASIALVLRQNKRKVLHVLSADGAELRALTSAVDVRGSASWSPDGTRVVVGGEDLEGQPGLFMVSVEGDRVEKIVEGMAFNPIWSPKGDLIVYKGPQVNAVCPVQAVRPDGTPVELPFLEILARGQRLRFLPDGKGIVHMVTSTNFHQDFWLLDLETMEDRELTRLHDAGTITTFDITPDGKRIVFDRRRDNSDIVMIDLADL